MRAEATPSRPQPRNRQISRFRERRGRRLARLIHEVATTLGRPVNILDLGGSRDYWGNVALADVATITLLNTHGFEFEGHNTDATSGVVFENIQGDATDLADFETRSVDFVHSNSVIEHVGQWSRIRAFAAEAARVGLSGWIQTPAFEFPLDTHSRLPFFHWFAQPVRAGALRLQKKHRSSDVDRRRREVDYVTHLSYGEMTYLFPEMNVYIERYMLLPKSYVVHWIAQDPS